MSKKKIPVYIIDSDVKPPDANVPLGLMSVGDSVLFPIERRNSVQSGVSRLKRLTSKRFTVKRVDEFYCRVWRLK